MLDLETYLNTLNYDGVKPIDFLIDYNQWLTQHQKDLEKLDKIRIPLTDFLQAGITKQHFVNIKHFVKKHGRDVITNLNEVSTNNSTQHLQYPLDITRFSLDGGSVHTAAVIIRPVINRIKTAGFIVAFESINTYDANKMLDAYLNKHFTLLKGRFSLAGKFYSFDASCDITTYATIFTINQADSDDERNFGAILNLNKTDEIKNALAANLTTSSKTIDPNKIELTNLIYVNN